MQYSTTGNILDNIFGVNSCSCLYRTACAILVDALTNIFINLVQLRITTDCPARVPIGREYQMAVSTRCINNFHTSGILDTVGGTKFSL